MPTLSITFEISQKDLEAALLPNGGKISSVTVKEEPKRRGSTKPRTPARTPKKPAEATDAKKGK